MNHPIPGFTLDRWGYFNIIASATKLTVAVDSCGIRFLIRGLQEDFKKLEGCGVVMLSVTEKFPLILLQKPVEIADPIQPLRVNDHSEPRIGQERLARGSSLRVVAVNRDDGFEITEGLSLQAIKTFGDEIGGPIDWQSYGDAWSRQIVSPSVRSTGGANALSADFCEIWNHG
jgi:hypothetical protein